MHNANFGGIDVLVQRQFLFPPPSSHWRMRKWCNKLLHKFQIRKIES